MNRTEMNKMLKDAKDLQSLLLLGIKPFSDCKDYSFEGIIYDDSIPFHLAFDDDIVAYRIVQNFITDEVHHDIINYLPTYGKMAFYLLVNVTEKSHWIELLDITNELNKKSKKKQYRVAIDKDMCFNIVER